MANDSGSPVSILQGGNVALVDATGALKVTGGASGGGDGAILDGVDALIKATVKDLANSNPLTVAIVDATGDQIASFGGGTQYTEDVAAAANPVGTALNLVRDDTRGGALTTTDGDNVAARGTNAGELYVKHVDAIPVTDNAGSLTVDNAALSVVGGGVEATALRVTVASDSTGVLSVDDNGGSLTVDGPLTDTQLRATAVPVSLASAPTTAVTQSTSPWIVAGGGTAGTAASGVATIQGIASMTPVQVSQATASNLNAQAVGNIAHDSADSGNPIKNGGKAISYGANPTGVTANDRTDFYANVAGIPFMLAGHPNVITRRDNYTAAQTDTAIITVSGGTKIVVLSCTVAADKANTVDVAVRCGFGGTNTPTGAGTYISHPGLPAGGGIREAGAVAGADGEDYRITSEVPTTGSIDVVTKYFTIES